MIKHEAEPKKVFFWGSGQKVLGFILPIREIKANPDKCQAVIDTKCPNSIKEFQQLKIRISFLSRLLPCSSDKSFHFSSKLKKKEKFEWTNECEDAFVN